MVLQPSQVTFNHMMEKIKTTPSYDGGDQGFLNMYFPTFTKLPFYYNAIQTTYIDRNNKKAWDLQVKKIKVIHFMEYKPWQAKRISGDILQKLSNIHKYWWKTYNDLSSNNFTITSDGEDV